jgi:hypothetical protein
VVQDELGQLGGLATARGSTDDHHGVVFYQRDELGTEDELGTMHYRFSREGN